MSKLQSSLANHVQSGETSPDEIRAMCRSAWIKHGIFCVKLDDIKGWGKRVQIEQIATETYGSRKAKP